ncbi:hypothetical protein QUF56_02575 [Ureibacillus composti]|nr:hypothetical protein [Ureibacillus composti]
MNNNIWIDKRLFSWDYFSTGGTIGNELQWKRPYIIWNRAKEFIENNNSEFDLADGIANLKRSLNSRLKNIEEIYKFKLMDYEVKPKGYLETLEIFGIIRPSIVKKLLIIQNDIEHNDVKPPSLDRCLELLDITWYFLKSTDSIVQISRSEVQFELCSIYELSSYYIIISYDFDKGGPFTIKGWIPSEIISDVPKENHIELINIKIHGIENYTSEQENFYKYKESDKHIVGNPILNSIEKSKYISKIIFSV